MLAWLAFSAADGGKRFDPFFPIVKWIFVSGSGLLKKGTRHRLVAELWFGLKNVFYTRLAAAASCRGVPAAQPSKFRCYLVKKS